MKQLKFMLAAATAISLATASQADTETSPSQFFEDTYEDAAAEYAVPNAEAGTIYSTKYSYPFTDGMNESKIAGEDGAKYLQVFTTTNPVLRSVQDSAFDLNANVGTNLYINTKIQFTVTPAEDGVTNSPTDKLMIYLKETAEGPTNLVIMAGKKTTEGSGFGSGTLTYSASSFTVDNFSATTNTWYDLKVVSFYSTEDSRVVFNVSMRESTTTEDYTVLESENDPNFYSMTANTEITYVGFAGEGKVDSIAAGKEWEVAATPVDFTFVVTWDDGISAVAYTINDGESTPATKGGNIVVAENATIEFTPTFVDGWKKLVDGTVLKFENVSADKKDIEFKTETLNQKVDDATGKVEINPAATTEAIAKIKQEAGITDASAFANVTEAGELGKVITWKKTVSDENFAAVAFKSAMVTNTAGEEISVLVADGAAAEAYLLNCDPSSTEEGQTLQDYKDNFKFEAADLTSLFDLANVTTEDLQKTIFNSKGYNGSIILEGKEKLSDGWKVRDTGHKFFRARLVK